MQKKQEPNCLLWILCLCSKKGLPQINCQKCSKAEPRAMKWGDKPLNPINKNCEQVIRLWPDVKGIFDKTVKRLPQ